MYGMLEFWSGYSWKICVVEDGDAYSSWETPGSRTGSRLKSKGADCDEWVSTMHVS
jgi:hypothetical protein